MSKKNAELNAAQDPEVAIESAISKTEQFIEHNGKKMLYVVAAIVIIVAGYFGYKYLYEAPRQIKAADIMYVAQQQFGADAFEMALKGDGSSAGFLEVIGRYGNTPAGNVANHYAAICYLKLGELDNAMKYLKAYDATKGAPNSIINAQNIGLQGDVLSEKGDYKAAVEKYNEAATIENNFTAPYYLKKAGIVYEKLGDFAKAVATYQSIADDYPASMEGRDIEKYIGAAKQK